MAQRLGGVHAGGGTKDLIIDTGHVVAFEPSVNWKVKKVSGFFTSLVSGEGLVCEFSGTGDVWLRTRSNQAFLDWLIPRLPTAHASSGGRGDIGGILGNVSAGGERDGTALRGLPLRSARKDR